MIDNTTGDSSGADVVTVDAGAMQDLTDKYTEYRENMDRDFFDPVRTLQLTGEVLASVREIVVNGRHTPTTLEDTLEAGPPQ